jgi:hypothetical protein
LILPAALWGASAAALAAPGGLNVIPTVDVYDPGVLNLEYQTEGAGRLFGRDCRRLVLTQWGAARGLEVGLDKCVSEPGEPVLLNAKYRLREEADRRPALAVGLQNVGRGQAAQPYLVAGWGLDRPTRRHLGAIRLEGGLAALVGVDYTWKALTFQADWVSGRENAASLGVSWALRPNVTVTYAAFLPNAEGGPGGHLLNLQWLIGSP